MEKGFRMLLGVVICVLALWTGQALAMDQAELEQTIKELRLQQQQMNTRLAELEQMLQAEKAKTAELEATVAQDMPAAETATASAKEFKLPSWLDDLKFKADLRLRYQGDLYEGDGRKDRHRGRFRLRFGFIRQFLDRQLEVGFRLASGSAECEDGKDLGSDPTSTNQTFDDFFSEKPIWIDQAYAKYTPDFAEGLTILAGKFSTPMEHTDMIWDSDVNPEGVWAEYRLATDCVTPFANVGYFSVEESGSGRDVILAAYQVGVETQIEDVGLLFAGTYYDYDHLEDKFSNANGNHVVGGRLAAEEFRMIDLLAKVSFNAFDLPMSLALDWAYNCGDEDPDSDYAGQNHAFAAYVKVGTNKQEGDWSAMYKYAVIAPNAVPGAFNDSDFGHANTKGHVLGAEYNLTKHILLGGKVFFIEPIVGSDAGRLHTLVQADLIFKF